jgi:hypothetical protein
MSECANIKMEAIRSSDSLRPFFIHRDVREFMKLLEDKNCISNENTEEHKAKDECAIIIKGHALFRPEN